MPPTFPEGAAVIVVPSSLTILARCNHTINESSPAKIVQMVQFSHSLGPVSVLMCNYTDVQGETGSERRLSLDMCHHVSTCFSF